MNVKKSSKQVDFRHSFKQQSTSKTSLRNLKMNRVSRCYRQISPLLTECDFDSDKENSAENFTFEDRNSKQINQITDPSLKLYTNQLSKSKLDITPLYSRQLNTQESKMSSQPISIRVPYDTQVENQIQSLQQYCDFIKEENRRYLAQILKMQAENDVLRQHIEEQHCVCKHKLQEHQPIKRQTVNQEINTEPYEQANNFTKQRNEMLWKLMELQEENSLQLQKIIELSSGISKQETFIQTDNQIKIVSNTTQETQTDESSNQILSQLQKHKQQIRSLKRILQEIEQACAEFSSFQEKDLVHFSNWLQSHFKTKLNAVVLPLQCQIKLLNEIIQSNKRTYEEKELHKAKLLKDAHTTISQLIEQTKQAQTLAKMNYHSFLVLQRKERCWKGRLTQS